MALSKIPADLITGGLNVDPAAPADAITVNSSGNVGIGTSSFFDANYPVEIRKDSGNSGLVLHTAGSGGRVGYLTNTRSGTFDIGHSTSNGGTLSFSTSPSGSETLTERMRIDSAGRITMPYQPSFRASLIVNPPTPYTAGGRILNFTSVLHNVGGHYDGTNKFTAPVAGRYVFLCDRALNTYGQDQVIRHPSMSFYKNGSGVHNVNTAISTNTAVTSSDYTHFTVSMSAVIELSANDYVQVYFTYANSPSTLWEYAENYFSGYLIG